MAAGSATGARKVIMAVDMDYFYAQCEETREPFLKTKPVVVCMFSGRTEESGAVATCNYVARGYGVRSGIPIFRAKELLKGVDAAFLRPDFDFYEGVSNKVMSLLEGMSDKIEPESIDEAYLDVSLKAHGSYEEAAASASRIKEAILASTGLTCSIGVGPNKLTGKMACDKSKPNGLLVVKEGEFLEHFGSLPVDRLYGVGKKTADKLEAMGAKTIEEMSQLSSILLREEFGRRLGLYYYLASKGIDDEPLTDWKREQVGRMVTLKEDTRDSSLISQALDGMAREIARELAAAKLSYRSVGVLVIDTILRGHSRSRSMKSEERNADAIVRVGKQLVDELFQDEPGIVARRLSVRVASLKSTAGQTDLTSYY